MSRQIFVNLPVSDLEQSIDFFTELGFSFDQRFTDENATCMIIGESSFVMLLVSNFFSTFTKKPISDAKASTEVLLAISAESKQEVDNMANKAVSLGGQDTSEPINEGGMYVKSFADLDGHQWEVMYMDENAIPE